MEAIKAIIIGIVQGLTEFLPVSSSGHIKIFKELFGMSEGLASDVLLHLGTLIAVCVFYWKDIIELIEEFFVLIGDIFSFGKKKIYNTDRPYRVLLIMIVITTIPTAIAGLLLEDIFDTIFSSLFVVGFALLFTSFFMYVASMITKGRKQPGDIKPREAMIVGIFQSVAIIPGLSRSGSTIFAGRLCGFSTETAVKYSFLCSIPAILGAVALNIGDLFAEKLSSTQVVGYGGGFIAAIAVGILSLKLLQVMAKKRNFKPFSYYCAIVGLFCIIYAIVT